MPAPHYSDLPTAVRHYIDEASWNLVKAALVALGQTGTPAFASLPTTEKPYIDQPSFDAVVDAIPAGVTLSGNETLDFPSIPRGESKVLSFTATGAVAGHVAQVGPPAGWDDEVSFCARVSATDTIKVIVTNNKADGTEYDPASGSWSWVVF